MMAKTTLAAWSFFGWTTFAIVGAEGEQTNVKLIALQLVMAVGVLLPLPSPARTGPPNDAPARPANAVYRCGNAYSQIPCADARVLDVDDSRSDADRAAGRDVAGRERALAAEMKRDRDRSDAAARPDARSSRRRLPSATTPNDTARRGPAPALASSSNSSRRNLRGDGVRANDDFVAFVPRPPKESTAKKAP